MNWAAWLAALPEERRARVADDLAVLGLAADLLARPAPGLTLADAQRAAELGARRLGGLARLLADAEGA